MTKIKKCKHGMFMYDPDSVVGRSLDLYKEYSEPECWFLGLVLKPKGVLVEVGAGIGCHAVAGASIVGPDGKVVAFETNRDQFYRLCGNAILNDARHIHCKNELDFEFDTVNVVKINDQELFDWAIEMTVKFKPYFYSNCTEDIADAVEKRLADLGYTTYRHVVPLYSPANDAGNSENVFVADGKDVTRLFVVGVPPGLPSPFPSDVD